MAENLPQTQRVKRPDIYIGLVCPAGTDLNKVREQLKAQLSVVGYDCVDIKVSKIISDLLGIEAIDDEYRRIKTLMMAGDSLREASPNGQGVACSIVSEIRRIRPSETEPNSTAYIIDSLKNPAEINLLDKIYGRNYYTLSIYKPREQRVSNLQKLIAKKRKQPADEVHKTNAIELIKEDEKGIGRKSQNVQDSFALADYFVNATRDVSLQIKRFVNLIFCEPFITPTPDEYYMFVARASALRSCDLSRQVGAVIVDLQKAIAATGCNEVPYPGGGMFIEERSAHIPDNRDWTKGHDPNWVQIQRSLIELIGVLKEAGFVSDTDTAEKIADELLHGRYKQLMSNARIRNLIEFGRVVHAEMQAISQAAQSGRAIKGATLYCTTFPCHGCARHIISSGISEVVFIEPYPKSLTQHLYGDEIELAHEPLDDALRSNPKKVLFRPFHGVAPILYQRVFASRDRKDDYGNIAAWDPKAAEPTGAIFGVERLTVETTASSSVADMLDSAKNALREKRGENPHDSSDASGSNP